MKLLLLMCLTPLAFAGNTIQGTRIDNSMVMVGDGNSVSISGSSNASRVTINGTSIVVLPSGDVLVTFKNGTQCAVNKNKESGCK